MTATRRLLLFAAIAVLVVAASGCEYPVDCSDINQPDMGGLVCIGRQVLAAQLTVIGVIIAILIGIGGPAVI